MKFVEIVDRTLKNVATILYPNGGRFIMEEVQRQRDKDLLSTSRFLSGAHFQQYPAARSHEYVWIRNSLFNS